MKNIWIQRDRVNLFIACALFISSASGKTVVPVFLCSGQSNMVGMASNNALSANEKLASSHMMINVEGQCDNSKKGKWLPLGPGFGNTSSNFGPELFFGKTLADSMPDQSCLFIKYAINGVPLGSSEGYFPPSSNNGTGGKLYKNLIAHIDKSMKSIHTAIDTSKYIPRWAGFIWLQGESDAKNNLLADKYEPNLENLISDIRDAIQVPDLPVIIPLITTVSRWKESAKVRGAVITVRERLENIDTVETKGFHLPDGMHYNAEGQKKIGFLAASRWLAMEYRYDNTVPVIHRVSPPVTLKPNLQIQTGTTNLFNLSGQKLNARRIAGQSQRTSAIFFIQNK